MFKTVRKASIAKFLSCFVFCLLFFTTAKSEKNDVRAGMKIEDAIRIARNCIHESSGIKVNKIRPGDTLEFLGVTDDLRIDALRRYIVTNIEIGVQSVWAYHKNDRLAQHYIISNSAFAKISKSWTVEQLAREISGKAGLPYLPFKKAAQIVADCRKIATGKSDQPETKTVINTDITDTGAFVKCLLDPEKGIPSAAITDPEGDEYSYTLAKKIIDDNVIPNGINGGWKYEELINFLAEQAEVPLSPNLTAARLVINAIIRLKTSDQKSQKLGGNELATFILSDLIREILGRNLKSPGTKLKENYTIADLGINPDDLKRELSRVLDEEVRNKALIRSQKRNSQAKEIQDVNENDLDIKPDTTVGEVIDKVEVLLEKQVNQK